MKTLNEIEKEIVQGRGCCGSKAMGECNCLGERLLAKDGSAREVLTAYSFFACKAACCVIPNAEMFNFDSKTGFCDGISPARTVQLMQIIQSL